MTTDHNATTWQHRRYLRHYRGTDLRPVEADVLVRHAEQAAGDVLELGPGTGRVTGHLARLARHVDAVDISRHMVAEGRRRHPEVTFHVGDIGDLSGFPDASFDLVIATCNVVDVFDDEGRRGLWREAVRLLRDGGVLVFSAHNRAYIPHLEEPWHIPRHRLLATLNAIARLPIRLRNRQRLQSRVVHAADYDILNDSAHDWALLLYFILPDDQRRQLEECGLDLVSCHTLDGTPVDLADPPDDQVELTYVATPTRARGSLHSATALRP